MKPQTEKTESKIGIDAEIKIEKNPADLPNWHEAEAAAHDHYERRLGRKQHLEKITNAVAPREHAADDPTRTDGPKANSAGPPPIANGDIR
jgi:hypothetical protein